MKISEKGVKLIDSFETCKLKAYPDPKTGGEPWTIGWGHTGGVKQGDTCTQAEADALQLLDLLSAEHDIDRLVTEPLEQNEYDALVSFVYNCGAKNLSTSTLLKKLNKGDFDGAADEFLKWVSPGSAVEKGLTRRRIAERTLFKGMA